MDYKPALPYQSILNRRAEDTQNAYSQVYAIWIHAPFITIPSTYATVFLLEKVICYNERWESQNWLVKKKGLREIGGVTWKGRMKSFHLCYRFTITILLIIILVTLLTLVLNIPIMINK